MPLAIPDSPVQAFPAELATKAQVVADRLAIGQSHPPHLYFSVRLNGEELHIPERVYYRPGDLKREASAPGIDGLIALCLGTRHHDGFVRQDCLRRVLRERHDWMIPFVVRLAGEYVAQIVALIEDALPELDAAAYGRFFRENPGFLAKTERRVVSYWYAYQHVGYRERGADPGSRVAAAFKRMAGADVNIGEFTSS